MREGGERGGGCERRYLEMEVGRHGGRQAARHEGRKEGRKE